MNKQELIEFLKDNLKIKIDNERVQQGYWGYTGENRLRISLFIREEDKDDIEIDYEYITKDDLEFVNSSEI